MRLYKGIDSRKFKLWIVAKIFTLIGIAGSPGLIGAHPFTIDQHNEPLTSFSQSIQFTGPIGVEFRPALSSLDDVELHTANSPNSGLPSPADLFVNIRLGAINGPILGTSSIINLPVGYDSFFAGPTHFDFFPTVPLSPNDLYFINLEEVPGGGNAAVAGSGPGDGLWFREGPFSLVPPPPTIPEPASLLLLGPALTGLALWRWKRGGKTVR